MGAELLAADPARRHPLCWLSVHRPDRIPARRPEDAVELTYDIRLKHRQGALIIHAPGVEAPSSRIDRALVRAVCLARAWADRLARGDIGSTKELARSAGFCDHYAARLMPLAFLAPDLTRRIFEGRQPAALSLGALVREPLPLDWDAQRRFFERIGERRKGEVPSAARNPC